MTGSRVQTLSELPNDSHVVTIGSFDGVHRGHKYLLDRLKEYAASLMLPSLVITFDPLPAEVLRPDKAPTRLCSTDDRTEFLLNEGIDSVVVLPFSEELSRQTAESFLADLITYAHPKAIVIGSDFAFGHQRKGTPEFLQGYASQYGYELEIVDRVNPDGLELSSSSVRQALIVDGDVRRAESILGRRFRLSGQVKSGDRRGRELGYPTANLKVGEHLTVPADGIYVGTVDDMSHVTIHSRPALIYIGTRPTFHGVERIVEVFLLDFSGDLYGEWLTIEFIDRLRGDKQFSSVNELVEQMKRDEQAGRAILEQTGLRASRDS